ncbi:M20/M25/M40 family metallo-hydrolase, partial [Staphylococcus epidermidis]|uniref:M20/M25/M40 family metallo-hydrolase n=1 Tax=Staphylococcus epidermidis TaxID=1282 RepID=UPI0037D9B586
MDGCGDDIDMGSILGSGIEVKEIEDELNGGVGLIFEAGEELGDGGFEMINSGVVKGGKGVVGFDNYGSLKVGEFGIKWGGIRCGVDGFEFNVK